eukprot:357908-Chlamydomonas_euryale.AAC.2
MPHYTAIPALNRTSHARPKNSAAFPGSHSLRAPFGSSSADFVPKAVPYRRSHAGVGAFVLGWALSRMNKALPRLDAALPR